MNILANQPTTVKFWPLIGVNAWRHKAGGGLRVWLLAKAIDKAGSGVVRRSDLAFMCAKFGVHPKTFSRWLKQALRLGLLKSVSRGARLLIASHAKGAYVLGCQHVGPRRAELPLQALFCQGWRGYVWAAYLATHKGRPITRAKLQELTGVPPSTQRALEKMCHADGRPNYIVSQQEEFFLAEWLAIKPHAFPFRDKGQQRRSVAWRGPNSYNVDGIASVSTKGRSKKVNRMLNTLNDLSKLGRVAVEGDAYVRLFNYCHEQTKKTLHKMAKYDVPSYKVPEIFQKRHNGPEADFWDVVPTFDYTDGAVVCA